MLDRAPRSLAMVFAVVCCALLGLFGAAQAVAADGPPQPDPAPVPTPDQAPVVQPQSPPTHVPAAPTPAPRTDAPRQPAPDSPLRAVTVAPRQQAPVSPLRAEQKQQPGAAVAGSPAATPKTSVEPRSAPVTPRPTHRRLESLIQVEPVHVAAVSLRPGRTAAGWLPVDPVLAAVLNVAVGLLAIVVTLVVVAGARVRRRAFTTSQ
jgi:hypothetical protein